MRRLPTRSDEASSYTRYRLVGVDGYDDQLGKETEENEGLRDGLRLSVGSAQLRAPGVLFF